VAQPRTSSSVVAPIIAFRVWSRPCEACARRPREALAASAGGGLRSPSPSAAACRRRRAAGRRGRSRLLLATICDPLQEPGIVFGDRVDLGDVRPSRSAWAATSSRSGRLGQGASAASIWSRARRRGSARSSRPSARSPARAAPSAGFWKVRPIAITSPTDFIAVVSTGSRPGTSRRRSAGSW
jgi:hypothetical protein